MDNPLEFGLKVLVALAVWVLVATMLFALTYCMCRLIGRDHADSMRLCEFFLVIATFGAYKDDWK